MSKTSAFWTGFWMPLRALGKTRHFGKVAGVDLWIDGTVLTLIGVMGILSVLTEGYAGLLNIMPLLIIFGCVLLHEYGHVKAANYYGVQADSITLYIIGGVAKLNGAAGSPQHEFVVAIAGPATNFLIALVMAVPYFVYKHPGAEMFFDINMRLALFNLLPFYPMDGGRILRSLTWWRLGHHSGTRVAARVGQVGAVAMFLAGFYFFLPTLWIIGPLMFAGCAYEIHKLDCQAELHPDHSAAP